MKKLKVYLDNCCFNRPYDDQSSQKIYLETEAKLFIQEKIRKNELGLIWSYLLEYENSLNPKIEVKNKISEWQLLALKDLNESERICKKGTEFHEMGLGLKDSLHIACAIEAKVDYFITVDKGILKKNNIIKEIKIIHPVEFILETGGKDEI